MKQNKYDNEVFFEKYSSMERSKKGLAGAGEWKTLEAMLPNFTNKRVLDLGCGFGWHCQYAIDHGASKVEGVDISKKMLQRAKKTTSHKIIYTCKAMEDIEYPSESFDIVISSLAFHYIKEFDDVVKNVNHCLTKQGSFIFSVEHPVFTAEGSQDWYYDTNGNIMHFPIDNYFFEGKRSANFLNEEVIKYHRTLTSYVKSLLNGGFDIIGIEEPQPSIDLLESVKGMKDELRRPMMIIFSARKK